jgi:glutamate racemase
VGVIGTKATVESRAYETAMAEFAPQVKVFPVACPLLAPLVEEGRFHRGDPVVDRVLSDYLAPLKAKGVDTLILGCTHYPLLYNSIAAIMPETELICSGPASTEALIDLLDRNGLRNNSGKPGSIQYYVSDAPARFAENGGKFIGREIHGSVTLVSPKAPSIQ